MKRILTVICFFLVNFSMLYAAGKADNVAKTDDVAKAEWNKLSKEVLELGLKKADDAISYAAKNADNWTKLMSTHADDASGIVLRKADDAARIGIKQGDNIIYDFTRVHGRIVAAKTDNVAAVMVTRADNAVRAGLNQGDVIYKRIPKIRGKWGGLPGDSTFFPDLAHVPKRGTQLQQMYTTPKTWKEIGEQNLANVQNVAELSYEKRAILSNNFKKFSSGEIGFTYKKGAIDFSPFAYDTIDIKSFGYDRIPIGRYGRDIPLEQGKSVMDIGDELLAKKWNWPTEDVTKFRQEKGLTWHERLDAHTIDLVPVDMHLIPHSGCHSVVNALVAR